MIPYRNQLREENSKFIRKGRGKKEIKDEKERKRERKKRKRKKGRKLQNRRGKEVKNQVKKFHL